MQNGAFDQRVQAVRQFTRFYTKELGILHEKLLDSPFSLAESRVLYELAHRRTCTAKDLSSDLDLDAGYLSRILARFARTRLIRRERSREDARHVYLRLTEKGRRAFQPLNRASSAQVSALLNRLPAIQQNRLVHAMSEVEHVLAPEHHKRAKLILRSHRPGDIGWVIQRHGALYAQEYGWDDSFEALVAEIAAQFIRNFDPKRERCWIAELDDEPVGSVFLVKQNDEVSKLRLLLVEPRARGLGIGRKLVEECIAFARAAGYRTMILWTQSILSAARNIYRSAGFKIIKEEPQRAFGADLVRETWELEL
jgi:DNA-binding MarR family transcriptional regulator/N-acetylglutamate synthase-like GNAT family acetyltransferase